MEQNLNRNHELKLRKSLNSIVGLINISIICKSGEVVLPFCLALVRSHLDNCVQFWTGHFTRDLDKLEKNPKRKNKSYQRSIKQDT